MGLIAPSASAPNVYDDWVCKTLMRRFESARRLQQTHGLRPRAARPEPSSALLRAAACVGLKRPNALLLAGRTPKTHQSGALAALGAEGAKAFCAKVGAGVVLVARGTRGGHHGGTGGHAEGAHQEQRLKDLGAQAIRGARTPGSTPKRPGVAIKGARGNRRRYLWRIPRAWRGSAMVAKRSRRPPGPAQFSSWSVLAATRAPPARSGVVHGSAKRARACRTRGRTQLTLGWPWWMYRPPRRPNPRVRPSGSQPAAR